MARFMSGWFKIHRKMWEVDLTQNGHLLAIWMTLLAWASVKEIKVLHNGKQETLPPGSLVFGYRELADQVRFSTKTVQKWIRYLQQSERISLKSSRNGTIVSIINWSTYQANEIQGTTRGKHEGRHEVNTRYQPIEEVKKERIKETTDKIFQFSNAGSKSLSETKTSSIENLYQQTQSLLKHRNGVEKSHKVNPKILDLIHSFREKI